MKKLFLFISIFAVALGASAQGAYDFKINEVCILGDSAETGYVDEYGQPSSWIEIENTSYSTHDIRNCYITTDRNVLKDMSAPEREKLMSVIPAGDPRTTLNAKQRITFFVDGNRNRGTLHTTAVVKLVPGKSNWIALYDGNAVDLLDSVTIPANLAPGASYARYDEGKWQIIDTDKVTPNAPNQEFSNDKISEFKEKDPYGIAMALMCMGVVFGCLILLFVFFHIFGWSMARIAKLNRVKAIKVIHEKASKVVVMAKEGTMETRGIEMENYAAVIGLALHEYFGGTHDIESGVLTINHTPSAWADKSHDLRTLPQHRPAQKQQNK